MNFVPCLAAPAAASEEASMGDRFHNWLIQFQSENQSLKSQVTCKRTQCTHTCIDRHTYNAYIQPLVQCHCSFLWSHDPQVHELEARLAEGSQRVLELQNLVGELEGRLTAEQSLQSSMLSDPGDLLSPSQQVTWQYIHTQLANSGHCIS